MVVRWLTAFIDRPNSGRDTAVEFWKRVTGSTVSPVRGERGQFATFLPNDGDAYLRVQAVLEGAGGTHLDLHVADVESATQRAVALGARTQPRDGAVTLSSPAGLVCCLVPATVAGLRRPSPVTRNDGHASLVDQVCAESPTASPAETQRPARCPPDHTQPSRPKTQVWSQVDRQQQPRRQAATTRPLSGMIRRVF